MLGSTRRTKSWSRHVWFAALPAITTSLVLGAGAMAASARAVTSSERPRGHQATRQRELLARHRRATAQYRHELARVRSQRSRNTVPATPHWTSGVPFQRGDVFLTGSGSAQEYTPSGQLVQTVPGSAGASGLCFDPSGRHLVLPGVGLFDRSGRLVPSNWASVPPEVKCVADGVGDIYVTRTSGWTVTKYDISGKALQTYDVASMPSIDGISGIDLAPDECTLYYSSWDGTYGGIGRFDVCTNTQGVMLTSLPTDDLRVMPNWDVLSTDDPDARLLDPSGQINRAYVPDDPPVITLLRYVSLDPDGTSFWVTTLGNGYSSRFDIDTGQQISEWAGGGPVQVYGPPLLGNADVARATESTSSGTAEVFLTRVKESGRLTRLHLWLDAATTAQRMAVGVYSNQFGQPGTLQDRGTIANVRPGSWNYVDVPAMPVAAGQYYWVAVLAPHGAGTAALRDKPLSGLAMGSARHDLTALPTRWSGGRLTLAGSLSAYGS